jgi:hypothetical protein
MLCIGGWDAPHPPANATASTVYDAWKTWNTQVVANGTAGFPGFDGLEWDIEGNDNNPEYQIMSVDTLNFMGELS